MDLNKKEILNRVKEITEELGYLFIELDFRGDSRNHILELFIDNESGITTVDCSKVSEVVGNWIEDEAIIKSRYRLNVSSPGVDRPLKYIQQFKKNVGRKFKLQLEENEDKKLEGELLEVNNDVLKFQLGKELKEININKIRSAKVLIRF